MPYVTDTHSLIWHMTNDPKGYLVDLKELLAFGYQLLIISFGGTGGSPVLIRN